MRSAHPRPRCARRLVALFAALAVLASAHTAFADVCVRADRDRDNLSADDREAIVVIVSDALESRGKSIADSECTATYTFYNVELGDTIRATLAGPEGKKQLETDSIDDLGKIYEQLVDALLEGKDPQEVADRENVTSSQRNRQRVSADNLGYVRLGYGMVIGADLASGPAFGAGWRHELRNFAIDVSIPNVIALTNNRAGLGITGNFIRLGGEYFFTGEARHTGLIGGGISVGWTAVSKEQGGQRSGYGNLGAQIEVAGGLELFRTSTVRMLVRANVVFPVYTSQNFGNQESNLPNDLYTPSSTISLIGAFGG